MATPEDLPGRIFNSLLAGEIDVAWELSLGAPRPEEISELGVSLFVPTPLPAAWVAWALAEFDRSFRWALRSAEVERPVRALYQDGTPVSSWRGLELSAVEAGSWRSRLDPSDALYRAFQSRPWVILTGVITAAGFAGWGLDHFVLAPPDSPAGVGRVEIVRDHSVGAPEISDVRGDVSVRIDNHYVEFGCRPQGAAAPDSPTRRPRSVRARSGFGLVPSTARS